MADIDIGAAITKYVELRDDLERIEKEAKLKKEPIAQAMETIASVLMKLANDQGVKSFKSAAGTAFIKATSRCGVGNWDETLKHIVENNAYNLLNRAVNKTAVEEYITAHEVPPPGVTWTVMNELQIRRA